MDAISIEIEVDVSGGNLPTYHVVGMPAQSVREGAVRIRSALEAGGQEFPQRKITVNLAPADLPKIGTAFDLPIAVGILVAEGVFELGPLENVFMMGELGLDGTLRKIRGALAATILAKRMGMRAIVLPHESAGEAAVVDGIDVYAASHLAEVVGALAGVEPLRAARVSKARPSEHAGFDFADVRGQRLARDATEYAVAGGHNLLLVGPPGIGKSMIARRVPTILPPLSSEEAIEITKVYSAAGLSDGLASERPFRAPHHTISTGALLGGGPLPRPGEITLAHNGVLFLDELPEFQRNAIEALRQPLEDREVLISRVSSTVRLPASFLLVASANPCPCGWAGSDVRNCTCTNTLVERYRNRLSGPLLDRIDLHVSVKPVTLRELRNLPAGETSDVVRARIVEARARQLARLRPHGCRTNAEMNPAVTRATCILSSQAENKLASLVERTDGLSARAIDRIIKVARTIADLGGRDLITDEDIGCAAGFRVLDCDPKVDPRRLGLNLPQLRRPTPSTSSTSE